MRAYELKVTLRGVRPPVWRRLKVRSDTTLEDLHGVLQDVMAWTDSHMHAFRPAGGRAAVERDEERRTRLDELLKKPKDRMVYEYDFGDSWEHEVLLERVLDHSLGGRYPWVLAGARACPPEDVGGVGGYARFLLGQLLEDECHGRIIYFSSCDTMGEHGNRLRSFLRRTDALAVCGFRRYVDWLTSMAFDLLFLREAQYNAFTRSGARAIARRVKKEAAGLASRLGST